MSVRKPWNKDLKVIIKKIRKKNLEEDLENDDDSLSENELVDEGVSGTKRSQMILIQMNLMNMIILLEKIQKR